MTTTSFFLCLSGFYFGHCAAKGDRVAAAIALCAMVLAAGGTP